jgi:hypothetical protein
MSEIEHETIYDNETLLEEEHKINMEQLKVILKSINIILTKNIHNIKLLESNKEINKDIINTFISYYCDMKKQILDLINSLSTKTLIIDKDSIQFIITYYQCKKSRLINIDILLNKYYHNEIQLNRFINNSEDILPIFEIVRLICSIDSIDAIIYSKDDCYPINSCEQSNYNYMLSNYKELYDKKFKIFNDIINLIQ